MEVKDLTLEEKVGQMLMVGIEGKSITNRTKKLILKYKIGGVILYRKNFSTYNEMLNLIKEIKELNKENKVPLFISIDQEGGRVNRMPKEIKNLPPVYEIGKLNDDNLIKEDAKIISELLKSAGFNMNLAPVMDIKRFNNKQAIGDRCFSENIQKVSRLGIISMKEFQNQGVIPVIKHFPGHGATSVDSHYRLPIINKSIEELEKEDMLPFINAVEEKADAIMVGHLKIKGTTLKNPTSLSRSFIGKYLRKKLKFNGVIMTDDLKMKAIRIRFGTKNAVLKAFKAGNDIILFRFSANDEEKSINKVLESIKNGEIKIGRINRSVKRILNLKEKYDIGNIDNKEIDINEINQRIEIIRNKVFNN